MTQHHGGRPSPYHSIEIMNDVVLNQIAVRFGAGLTLECGDDLTQKVIAEVQKEGICFAGGAKWKNRWIMGLSVIGFPTTEDDALRSATAIAGAWRRVQGS